MTAPGATREILGGLAVAVLLLASAGEASGAQVVEASGPLRVDGKEVRVLPGRPLPVRRGAVVETAASPAVLRSDAGDEIRLEAGASLRNDGTQGGVEYLLLRSGAAEATLGPKTSLGSAAGWASAPAGFTAVVRAAAAAPEGGRTFRTLRGSAWIRCRDADVWLPEGAAAILRPDAGGAGTLGFAAPADAGTPFAVVVRREPGRRPDGVASTSALVPPGGGGTVAHDRAGGATRWRCDRTVADGSAGGGAGRLRIEVRRGGTTRFVATLGPGVGCEVDARGAARVEVPGVAGGNLERLLALEVPFDTL